MEKKEDVFMIDDLKVVITTYDGKQEMQIFDQAGKDVTAENDGEAVWEVIRQKK